MNISVDDNLLDDDDELEDQIDPADRVAHDKDLDARRMIERRLELKRLREQLDDPDFDFGFD